DGRHQERPPIMGLEKALVLARIRLHGGGAERLAAAGGVAELAGPARGGGGAYGCGSASMVRVRSAWPLPVAWPNWLASSASGELWLRRSVRVRWISSRRTPSKEKCWKMGTMAENASG